MTTLGKISAATTVAGILLFGSHGLYLLATERRDLERAVEREARLVARSLRVSVENALRDQQIADAREVLDAVERLDPSFAVAVYDGAGRALAADRDDPPTASQRAILQAAFASPVPLVRFDPPADPTRLLVAVRLGSEAREAAVLLLDRPLDDLRADLRRTRSGIVLSVAGFALVSGALGLLLGTLYVRRPLIRLIDAMQRVRGGDLESAVPVGRADEFGAVALEFNAMLAELRAARARLRDETGARERLQHQLERADKLITVGQLSAGLAHEIGSPLQVLNGRARALRDAAGDPARTRRVADILVAQSDRIAGIVGRLLRYARHRPPQLAWIDPAAPVRAVLELLETEARDRGVAMHLLCADHLPRIRADADQLQQVVLNLLRNALAATPRGGAVRVELAPLDGPPPALRLAVVDSGRGIDERTRARLFEPFFTTQREAGGTGLGLAVVKWIVTAHGGRVTSQAGRGDGSAFVVDLPVGGAAEPA